jgi:hypothetical protein
VFEMNEALTGEPVNQPGHELVLEVKLDRLGVGTDRRVELDGTKRLDPELV